MPNILFITFIIFLIKIAENPDFKRKIIGFRLFSVKCGMRDSNPHALRHKNLNLACLPIPSIPPGTAVHTAVRQYAHYTLIASFLSIRDSMLLKRRAYARHFPPSPIWQMISLFILIRKKVVMPRLISSAMGKAHQIRSTLPLRESRYATGSSTQSCLAMETIIL